jgi:hypothetical protein
LLSLVFYKIYTKITHKLYVELRSGLVCMECRELCHNRHTVSLRTNRVIVSPKANRTRRRYVRTLHSSQGFSGCGMGDLCAVETMEFLKKHYCN